MAVKGFPHPAKVAVREQNSALASRARRIARKLARLYPHAKITLDFATPWQCLVATILSAQCTDERVNRLTPALFAKFPGADTIVSADRAEIERMILSAGFFREKSKSIKAAAEDIVRRFGGRVPDTMEELLTLRGVGRKTANVLLGHVFEKPGMAVDTHVRRVSFRLGLTKHTDPDKIERDLTRLLAPAQWTLFSMRLILHGRRVCLARNPGCGACALSRDCLKIGVKAKERTAETKPARR
jgi:endonuclease III